MRNSGEPRSARHALFERLFASSVVIYTFVATYVVGKTLTKYGAHWYIFFIIDLPTSWFYGIATSRLVMSIVKRRFNEISKWGWIAAINFALPQVYILYYAHNASRQTLVIFALIVVALAASSLYTLFGQIKKSRQNG
jgi:uncharacterized membrane protein YhaH (DUF805 family)